MWPIGLRLAVGEPSWSPKVSKDPCGQTWGWLGLAP
jgi:hypothetical protein